MAASSCQVAIDCSLVLQVARRLAAAPHDPALIRHLEALMREQGMVGRPSGRGIHPGNRRAVAVPTRT